MKLEEFDDEVSKLERFYQKEITEEQGKIWYSELRNLDISRFRYIISQVYRTSKFLPKLADILEINANLGYSQVKQEENNNKCKRCNATGYLTYKRTTKNGADNMMYEFAAICSCRTKPKYEGWKITDERYRSNNYTPFAEEVGI